MSIKDKICYAAIRYVRANNAYGSCESDDEARVHLEEINNSRKELYRLVNCWDTMEGCDD